MRRIVTLSVLMLVLAAGLAQAAMKGSADVVKAAPTKAHLEGTRGQRVAFAIQVDISPQWHIYAHGDSNFIGVDLAVPEDFPLRDLEVIYPQGHPKELFGEKVFMIEGHEVIKASALVPADLPTGARDLSLGVTVQACDNKTCLAPVDLPVKIRLDVK